MFLNLSILRNVPRDLLFDSLSMSGSLYFILSQILKLIEIFQGKVFTLLEITKKIQQIISEDNVEFIIQFQN